MNIPKDKLIRCAKGLGLECASDGFYMEDRFTSWESRFVPILLTYAPGGIMDEMGWEYYYNPAIEKYYVRTQFNTEIISEPINTFNDIPAAAIYTYLDMLDAIEKRDKYNNINNIEVNIKVMKVKLDQMSCELKRLKEGR